MTAFETQTQAFGFNMVRELMLKVSESGKSLWQHGWTAREKVKRQRSLADVYGPNSAWDKEMRVWPRIIAPFRERRRDGEGSWEDWRIKGLEFLVHLAAEVPCYCCYVDSYCIKYLTCTIKMWKWPTCMCANGSLYEKCFLVILS